MERSENRGGFRPNEPEFEMPRRDVVAYDAAGLRRGNPGLRFAPSGLRWLRATEATAGPS